jgi:RNA polymerase sigma factor (sigma-70 family)
MGNIFSKEEEEKLFHEKWKQFGKQIERCAKRFTGLGNYDTAYVESLITEMLLYTIRKYKAGVVSEHGECSFKTFFWKIVQQKLFRLQESDKRLKRSVQKQLVKPYIINGDFRDSTYNVGNLDGQGFVPSILDNLSEDSETEKHLETVDIVNRLVIQNDQQKAIVDLLKKGYSIQEISKTLNMSTKKIRGRITKIKNNTLKKIKEI